MNTQIEYLPMENVSPEKQTITTLFSDQFPGLLRHIPSCPKRLFMEGALSKTSDGIKYLCIVGSRKYSQYGADACRELIAGLSGYNICIVSGLAIGIDGIAHEAALSAGLHTIAFPGSGLRRDVLYPARNHQLARRIIAAGGALLSEFDMDFHATDWSFPQRNRLMAGIAHATLIIEAKEKSGTLITAAYALDFNRDVCAVPGSIFSTLSWGPNELIREGAIPVNNSSDILYALGIKERPRPGKDSASEATSSHHETISTAISEEITPSEPLTDEEKNILDILAAPISKDELLRILERDHGMDIQDANILISMMELKSYIDERHGMMFAKKITSM